MFEQIAHRSLQLHDIKRFGAGRHARGPQRIPARTTCGTQQQRAECDECRVDRPVHGFARAKQRNRAVRHAGQPVRGAGRAHQPAQPGRAIGHTGRQRDRAAPHGPEQHREQMIDVHASGQRTPGEQQYAAREHGFRRRCRRRPRPARSRSDPAARAAARSTDAAPVAHSAHAAAPSGNARRAARRPSPPPSRIARSAAAAPR